MIKRPTRPCLPWLALAIATAMTAGRGNCADRLALDFAAPPQAARPYVWWDWLENCANAEGIDRDLAAMQESGVGGALVINLSSLPSAPGSRLENSPWQVPYASPAWWALMRRALSSGESRNLDMGVENCPGWAVSGGPWITPELSMQKLVWTATPATGPGKFSAAPPAAKTSPKWTFYRDVAWLAVPAGENASPGDVIDLRSRLQPDGRLDWEVPPGAWTIYRFGHTTTGRQTNPMPDGYEALEVDKLSAGAAAFHIEHLLATLRASLGPDFAAVHHVNFDSFEAGPADWTEEFPQQFKELRGYDPLPWLPVLAGRKLGGPALSARFLRDLQQTLSDLFIRNYLATCERLLKAAGIRMSLEPYTGPFDTVAATAECGLPMSEFWSNPQSWLNTRMDRHDQITRNVAASAQALGNRIVAAEALTGFPMDSMWTEAPASLKPAVDGAIAGGINQFYLHSWVLQPFGGDLKPGLTLGWWGTHFGRNQTWFGPGKAFFTYLARCAAVLQHGAVVSDFCALGFAMKDGDAISGKILLGSRVEAGGLVTPAGRRYAAVVLPPDARTLEPEIAAKIGELVAAGAVVVGPKPEAAPGLGGYPESDRNVAAIGELVWGPVDGVTVTRHRYGRGEVFWGVPVREVLAQLKIAPDLIVESESPAEIRTLHRREGDTEIYFVANLGPLAADTKMSFRVQGKIPEFWFPVSGRIEDAALWSDRSGRTRLPVRLGPNEARFVVFRRSSFGRDPIAAIALSADFHPLPESIGLYFIPDATSAIESADSLDPARGDFTLKTDDGGKVHLSTSRSGRYDLTFASGRHATLQVPDLPKPLPLPGPWVARFPNGSGAPAQATFKALASWTASADAGVKYFSGTATYVKRFVLSARQLREGVRVWLDLGSVQNLAQVGVNGHDLGVLWTQPFSIDVTDSVQVGPNDLEIAVTNTWRNRLIGDEQLPADLSWREPRLFRTNLPVGAPLARFPDWLVQQQPRPSGERRTFVSWNYFTKESPLVPGGLLGPVVLRFEADVVASPP